MIGNAVLTPAVMERDESVGIGESTRITRIKNNKNSISRPVARLAVGMKTFKGDTGHEPVCCSDIICGLC